MKKDKTNVKDIGKTKDKAKIFVSALNNIRWNSTKDSYSELNLYDTNVSAEDKILAHWITYISDRGMPFENIWIFGGYVYSQIIFDWHKCKSISEINKVFNEHINIQVEKGKEKGKIFGRYDNLNKRINNELEMNNSKIDFTSRFYTTDIVYIYLTLCYLTENHNSSLFNYLKEMSKWTDDAFLKLKSIAYGLYLLSYKDNSPHTLDDINKLKKSGKKIVFSAEYKKIKDNINEFKCNPEAQLNQFDNSKDRFGNMKRLWCCIRDYLKAYYYKDYFNECLKANNMSIGQEAKNKMLKYIELPGDVWNNNNKFRKCIIEIDNGDRLSQLLRNDYKNNKNEWEEKSLYPECFDVSFDLAMKMCDNNKCKYCLMSDDNCAIKLCLNKEGGLCPLAMIYCGYEYKCIGRDSCVFKCLV